MKRKAQRAEERQKEWTKDGSRCILERGGRPGKSFFDCPQQAAVPVPEGIGLATGRYLKIVGMPENNIGKDKQTTHSVKSGVA